MGNVGGSIDSLAPVAKTAGTIEILKLVISLVVVSGTVGFLGYLVYTGKLTSQPPKRKHKSTIEDQMAIPDDHKHRLTNRQ